MMRKSLLICIFSYLLSCQLTLSAPIPAYSNYQQYLRLIDWQGKSSTKTADADNDGLSNWQEYASGRNPLIADTDLSIYQVDQSTEKTVITYPINPAALDACGLIEKSENKFDWQPVSIKTDTITINSLPNTYIQKATVKIPNDTNHYRVSIIPRRQQAPPTKAFEVSRFEAPASTAGIKLTATSRDQIMNPQHIVEALRPFGKQNIHIVFEGYFRIGNNLPLENYEQLTISGLPHTYLEQTCAFNDAAPINLHNCKDTIVKNIKLGGAGAQRSDGEAPGQNGIRVIGSQNVTIRNCTIQPTTNTMKIAVNLIDSKQVTIQDCQFQNISHACIISGTGIWPHPTDAKQFIQPNDLRCSQIEVTGCQFESVSVGIAFDDETQGAVARNNQFRNHYGHAIIAEDGSTNIVIENNHSFHGRGALAVAGTGQTRNLSVPITISNNVANNANDPNLIAPPHYFSNTPVPSAYHNTNHPGVTLKNNREVP